MAAGIPSSSLVGSTNIMGAYNALTNLLNQGNISNLSAASQMDPLAQSQQQTEQTAMGEIARRGLTTTGAVPNIERGIQQRYAQTVGDITGQTSTAEAARQASILNAMLGIGSDAQSQINALSQAQLAAQKQQQQQTLSTAGDIGGVLTSLFGVPTGTGPYTSGGGLLSSGITTGAVPTGSTAASSGTVPTFDPLSSLFKQIGTWI